MRVKRVKLANSAGGLRKSAVTQDARETPPQGQEIGGGYDRMPDGPALYDWIAANRPELVRRIAFVTGDTLGPSAGRFLARSGCPVIEKPFTPDDIAAVPRALTAK